MYFQSSNDVVFFAVSELNHISSNAHGGFFGEDTLYCIPLQLLDVHVISYGVC